MLNKEKCLCFTGHRTEKLPQSENELGALRLLLYQTISEAVKSGFDTFITGMCYGFDLIAAMQVLRHKQELRLNESKDIKLIAVIPFDGQAYGWHPKDRKIYYTILAACDEVVKLNSHYKSGCYHERNRWMVDNSVRVIAYYDGSGGGTGYTLRYAQKTGLPIINLYQE